MKFNLMLTIDDWQKTFNLAFDNDNRNESSDKWQLTFNVIKKLFLL